MFFGEAAEDGSAAGNQPHEKRADLERGDTLAAANSESKENGEKEFSKQADDKILYYFRSS